LTGDGLCVGHDSGSAVTTFYTTAFPFVGAKIERVIADSAAPLRRPRKNVLAYIALD
jgi:hypothetical protein